MQRKRIRVLRDSTTDLRLQLELSWVLERIPGILIGEQCKKHATVAEVECNGSHGLALLINLCPYWMDCPADLPDRLLKCLIGLLEAGEPGFDAIDQIWLIDEDSNTRIRAWSRLARH